VSRAVEGATAFGNRQASHAITLDGVWRPGEDVGDRDTAWAKKFFAALGPFRQGVYVNFLGRDEDGGRVREAYGGVVYDRLVQVKYVRPRQRLPPQSEHRPALNDEAGGSDCVRPSALTCLATCVSGCEPGARIKAPRAGVSRPSQTA
jgi:hypothetical protein